MLCWGVVGVVGNAGGIGRRVVSCRRKWMRRGWRRDLVVDGLLEGTGCVVDRVVGRMGRVMVGFAARTGCYCLHLDMDDFLAAGIGMVHLTTRTDSEFRALGTYFGAVRLRIHTVRLHTGLTPHVDRVADMMLVELYLCSHRCWMHDRWTYSRSRCLGPWG